MEELGFYKGLLTDSEGRQDHSFGIRWYLITFLSFSNGSLKFLV